MRTKIKVIDSIMGSGKTSFAIQMMNKRRDERFLYITPFLDEVSRVCKACSRRGFVQPIEKNGQTKSKDLKTLLDEGRNIATTHELFKLIDDESKDLIKAQGYILIMDEVMEVIAVLENNKDEVQAMIRREILAATPDEETQGKISMVACGAEPGLGRYAEFKQWANQGRLVLIDDRLLIWLFPANIFESFNEVWNLCYIFEGQTQKAYYDMNGLEYEYLSVVKNDRGEFQAVPYEMNRDAEKIQTIRTLVNIYEGKLNELGEENRQGRGRQSNPYSKNWYKNRTKLLGYIKNHTYNYFKNVVCGSAEENLWTTFKTYQKSLSGKGYAKGFISKSTRSTNKYREKKNLAYLVNVFLKPEVQAYFLVKGIKVDEDLYALSELIQWVWRSRIRDGKEIYLYLPALRMRTLLRNWLSSASKILQEVA